MTDSIQPQTNVEVSVSSLVAVIKAHLAKGAQSADKADQHFIAAGLLIKELKTRKPNGAPWPEYVRKTFGLGRERADELIRIADGRTSVEKVRAGGATRAAKNIAKLKSGVTNTGSASASAESPQGATETDQIVDAEPSAVEVSKRAAVNAQAGRAEQTSAAAKELDILPTLIELMNIFERMRAPINMDRSAGELSAFFMEQHQRVELLDQILDADEWLRVAAQHVLETGGAILGRSLAPINTSEIVRDFLKEAIAKVDASLERQERRFRDARRVDRKPTKLED
jgi:hypothetical protein